LNKTLITMMVPGPAGGLVVIAYSMSHTSFFASALPFRKLAERIEDLTTETIDTFPTAGFGAPPKRFWRIYGTEIAYIVVDATGLGVIVTSGLVARVLQARWRRGDTRPIFRPLDAGAASPL
jgi:hypothetical protein